MNIADEYIKRQILTQRYIRALTRKYNGQLRQLNDLIANMIANRGSTARLEEIRRDIEFAIGEAMSKFNMDMIADMQDLSEQELDFVTKTINANTKVLLRAPEFDLIKSAIMNNPLDVELANAKLTLGQALEEFAAGQAKAIRQVMFDGIATGQTPKEIAKGIRALAGTRSKPQVEALTRTLSNHTTAQTRKAFAEEYRDVFTGEEWLATLDSRTTKLCAGRDGKVYRVGAGPYPPAHWNCRSLRVPVIDDQYDAQTNKSDKKDFDTWLRQQPKDFQEEYFAGSTKASEKLALFRKGDLKIEQYRDESGREYSLDELIMFYGDAARKAGITNSGL